LKNAIAARNWTEERFFQVDLAAQFLSRSSVELTCMIRKRSSAVSDEVAVCFGARVAAIAVEDLAVFRQAIRAMTRPISAPFSVSTVNIWKFFEVVELLANMIKDLDIFFGNTYSQKSFVKLGRDASRVQNIGENLGERASASWATSIFGRASERELDDFRFFASERASSLSILSSLALAS
jgi:hypothetical protein